MAASWLIPKGRLLAGLVGVELFLIGAGWVLLATAARPRPGLPSNLLLGAFCVCLGAVLLRLIAHRPAWLRRGAPTQVIAWLVVAFNVALLWAVYAQGGGTGAVADAYGAIFGAFLLWVSAGLVAEVAAPR